MWVFHVGIEQHLFAALFLLLKKSKIVCLRIIDLLFSFLEFKYATTNESGYNGAY